MAQSKLHPTITERRVLAAVERAATSLDNPGFCLACGAEAHGVEPDARRYVCEFVRHESRLRRRMDHDGQFLLAIRNARAALVTPRQSAEKPWLSADRAPLPAHNVETKSYE